ncbi:MAG: glycerophosphodiester phosphodiesterase [Actinomycetota bacterium]
MEVIGHRGAAAFAPENTLESIAAALSAGADGVEIDVRMSSDGVLVLMHDPDVARTTNGTGRVAELTGSALGALVPPVPLLDEVFATVPRDALLVLELKGHPWEAGYDPAEPVAHALAAALVADGERRVVVSSFNPLGLGVIRTESPGVRTAVLTSEAFDLGSNLAAAVDGGHEECHVPGTLADAAFVTRAHEAGKRVVAWTVNDPDRLRELAAAGVDAAITDDPRTAIATLRY